MSVDVLQEAHVFTVALVTGMGLMLLYDLLRLFRRILSHGPLWVGVEDLLYWILFTLVVFGMLRREYHGTLRGFALAGVATGLLIFWEIGKLMEKAGSFGKKTLKNLWKAVRIALKIEKES